MQTKSDESPFTHKLEIGIRKEGYWKYLRMVVQLAKTEAGILTLASNWIIPVVTPTLHQIDSPSATWNWAGEGNKSL
jgi:hypothetical protein